MFAGRLDLAPSGLTDRLLGLTHRLPGLAQVARRPLASLLRFA